MRVRSCKRSFALVLRKIIFSLALILCSGAVQNLAEQVKLPERYKKWLEEEVVYIIAPVEKEVFQQLKTDRERDFFIQAFWKHRDPSPGDIENEFKQEHLRRIIFSTRYFGRGVTKPGWRTDRGRIYIMLGEPNDIQRFEGKTQVYPSEVWFYQGMSDRGLPPAFHLVFFQNRGIGEYRLYSPLSDGPQALLTSFYGDPMDYIAAYQQLREFTPELSEVSLSLIPGESTIQQGRPSLSSDLLINKVETTPQRNVEDRYARKFLEYKDVIEVEYSTNYIDSDALVQVMKDPSGIYFVHYAIEPARLSVNNYEDKYYTTLRLNGTVTDSDGKTIHQFEKNIPLEFKQEQLQQISHRPVSIRDMFPLIPGQYRLSVLVKNETSKEFTSLERNLLIPDDNQKLQMTSLILGYRVNRKPAPKRGLRPFQAGDYQILFQANRIFLRKDNLAIAFQIHGLTPPQKETAELRYTLSRAGDEIHHFRKPVADYLNAPNFVESFSLQDFPPAHYRIRVSLFIEGQEVLSTDNEFDITHAESIPRPWIYSKLLAGTESPVYAYVLGNQLLNKGRIEEAKEYIEKAYRANPENVEISLSMSRVLMALKAYERIPSVLASHLQRSETPRFEAYLILGEAYRQLGEYDEAISVFQKALAHHGMSVPVLNALGDCYYRVGNSEDALVTWEKSLELNADQPPISQNVKRLKEKK